MNLFAEILAELSDDEVFALLDAENQHETDAQDDSPITALASLGRANLLKRLKEERGLDVRVSGSIGNALKSKAPGAAETLDYLLSLGEPLWDVPPDLYEFGLSQPLLHEAVLDCRFDMVRILRRHGADPKWKNEDGENAFRVAGYLPSNLGEDMIAVLKEEMECRRHEFFDFLRPKPDSNQTRSSKSQC